METIKLQAAKDKDKKWIVKIGKRVVSFGQYGASDYLTHHDQERKNRYIERHIKEEKFWDPSNKDNLLQPSFWSRYLTWEKEGIFDAIDNIEKIANVRIKYSEASIEKHQKKLTNLSKSLGH